MMMSSIFFLLDDVGTMIEKAGAEHAKQDMIDVLLQVDLATMIKLSKRVRG
jgi:hypothetical protein